MPTAPSDKQIGHGLAEHGRVASTLSNGTYTDEIWAEGERVAEVVGGGVSTVHFFHADQVGTTRAVADANANNLVGCGQNSTYPNGSFLTYSPFGTPMDCTQSATAYKFTSKEQDAESSLDHFRYCKYSALQARWLTPDPAGTLAPSPWPAMLGSNLLPFGTGLPNPLAQARSCSAAPNVLPGFGLTTGAADPSTPQSLNAYGYAAQSPARWADFHGLFRLSCFCWLDTAQFDGWISSCFYGCFCSDWTFYWDTAIFEGSCPNLRWIHWEAPSRY